MSTNPEVSVRRLRWALYCTIALLSLVTAELLRFERSCSGFRQMVSSDLLVVPWMRSPGPATAGMGISKDRKDVSLWLGEFSSNRQVRLAVENGLEYLRFYDGAGRLRLELGLDRNGEPSIGLLDKDGKTLQRWPVAAVERKP